MTVQEHLFNTYQYCYLLQTEIKYLQVEKRQKEKKMQMTIMGITYWYICGRNEKKDKMGNLQMLS